MDYTNLTAAISKYLKKRYRFQILNDIRNSKPFIAERSELNNEVPGLPEEVWEILLEQMSEDGHIAKDDGRTVTFSTDFVFGKK